MESHNPRKKTMGRRKIEIKKIEKKSSLQVAFSKRRQGLFRKASELSVLCGAEIAILVQSPADKMFAFGNPSVEYVLDRFQTGGISRPQSIAGEERGGKYEEALRKLEGEKEKEQRMKEFWWTEEIGSMELYELEEYFGALEGLRKRVFSRVEEVQKLKIDASCSGLFQFNDHDYDGHCSLEGLTETEKETGSSCLLDQIEQDFEGFGDFEDLCHLENLNDFCA